MGKQHGEKESHSKKGRILVAEDEPEVARTVRDILLDEGFAVEVVRNGKEALDLLMTGRRFDLLITNVKMPEMDGLELLRRVRQFKEYLPVILLTGYADPTEKLTAIQEGISAFVTKPFRIENLMRAVHETLKDTGFEVLNKEGSRQCSRFLLLLSI
jgi:CheY-like chemotaxis protein